MFAQRRDGPARVAILDDTHEGSRKHLIAVFRNRLQELGYVEGKSYVIETRWAKGEAGRLPALAAELVALKPDLIVALGTTPALAAKQASSTIPIVVLGMTDPLRLGLATSLGRPEGNLTGNSGVTPEVVGKWVELLREIAPTVKSIAYMTDMQNPVQALIVGELHARGEQLGIKLQAVDGHNPEQLERSFALIASERMDGLIVSAAGTLWHHRQQVVDAVARARIPAIYGRPEYVQLGGLLSYGPDANWLYSRGADYAHRILQGAKPSELPIEQTTSFKLLLNLKTANALGLKIPQTLLASADEVIR